VSALTVKETVGLIGEKLIASAFPKEYKVIANDWNNYRTYMHKDGEPVDGKIFDAKMRLCGVYEVKNWTDINRQYCLGTIQTDIKDRFNQYPHVFKILFISYVKLMSSTAIKRIKDAGIHIVEIGKRINGYDFKTSLLFKIRTQIRKLIHSLTSRAQPNFIQHTLLNLSVNVNNTNTNNLIDNNKLIDNNRQTNSTNKGNKGNRLYFGVSIDDAECQIMEERRLESERIRLLHGKG